MKPVASEESSSYQEAIVKGDDRVLSKKKR
jgi:hypothetical protein